MVIVAHIDLTQYKSRKTLPLFKATRNETHIAGFRYSMCIFLSKNVSNLLQITHTHTHKKQTFFCNSHTHTQTHIKFYFSN